MHEADIKPIESLNRLIAVNNNRMECLDYADRHTNAGVLKVLFNRLKETCEDCYTALVSEVYKLGGTPHDGTLATADFLKVWDELNAAVSRNDHFSILNSLSIQEGVVLKNYGQVLSQGEAWLNTNQKKLFTEQYEAIYADVEKVRNLRDVIFNAVLREAIAQERKALSRKGHELPVPAFSYNLR
jgi:uncharacterized protein (TIGR02284 family)